MKFKIMSLVVFTLLFGGCSLLLPTGVGDAVEHEHIRLSNGGTFADAVMVSAQKRGWRFSLQSAKEWELSLQKRNYLCVVKVVDEGDAFSILPVQSNVAIYTYNQWVGNLRQDIVRNANAGIKFRGVTPVPPQPLVQPLSAPVPEKPVSGSTSQSSQPTVNKSDVQDPKPAVSSGVEKQAEPSQEKPAPQQQPNVDLKNFGF